jgi:holo-[acyl-carrier protein] synthase
VVDGPPGVPPLPGVTGVGVDLVEVERVRAALERQAGLRQRLFTEGEWDYAARHRDPLPHLAARFAAKESVMKALGQGMQHMSFHEIEVVRDERSGAPGVQLHGRAAAVATAAGVDRWHLSLTHTASLAQAVAIALRGVEATP